MLKMHFSCIFLSFFLTHIFLCGYFCGTKTYFYEGRVYQLSLGE